MSVLEPLVLSAILVMAAATLLMRVSGFWLMGRVPLEIVVVTKALAHWVTTGLPLVIASPVLGLFLNLEPAALGATALTLLVGTPALTLIAA